MFNRGTVGGDGSRCAPSVRKTIPGRFTTALTLPVWSTVAVSDVFEKLAAAGTQPFAGDDRVDLRLRKRDDFAGREISADNNGQLA